MEQSQVLKLIQSHQAPLQKLGVKSLNIFGSVARNQATLESDVDILVELDEIAGFFEFFRIKHYLEDLLGCSVDLGTVDALREDLRAPVLEEAVCAF